MIRELEPGEVRDYVQRKGWEIQKHEGDELILASCPLCGEESRKRTDRNFYLNSATGQFSTYCCQAKGNLITLKRDMGDLPISSTPFGRGDPEVDRLTRQLKKHRGSTWEGYTLPPVEAQGFFLQRRSTVPGAAEYLGGRGLAIETLDHFGVGVARRGYCGSCSMQVLVQASGSCHTCNTKVSRITELIAIPSRVNKRVVNFKFRSFEGEKRFEKWNGAPNVLFNIDVLDNEFKSVLICEAEIDVMTLHQYGYPVAIATGTAGRKLTDEELEALAPFDEVLIAYDNDKAGDDGAEKLAKQLGRYRCARVRFPKKDANDCLKDGMDSDEFRTYIEGASAYRVSNVKAFSEFEQDLLDMKAGGDAVYGRDSMWLGFNRLIGGWRDGEVTVVTGDTGSGKTTWTTAIVWDQARGDPFNDREGVGVLLASFETLTKDVARKLVTMEANKSFRKMEIAELQGAIDSLKTLNLFFLDHYGEISLEDLEDAIEYGVRRFGLRMVSLDHLHFMINSPPQHERFYIDRAMRLTKKWALRLGIHVLLVVHPAKLRNKENGEPCKVELNDLKGSSEIKKIADTVVRVYVSRTEDRSQDQAPATELTILKARSDFAREGQVWLDFDTESLRYTYSDGSEQSSRQPSAPNTAAQAAAAVHKTPPSEPDPQEKIKLYEGGVMVGLL